MLLSTSISLAQEIGCFDEEIPTETAEDAAPPLEWNRILCTFIRLTDENLALRLRIEPQLTGRRYNDVIGELPRSLTVDGFWESAMDPADHASKARELLRNWRRCELGIRPAIPISALEGFRRGLDRWDSQQSLIRTGT